MIYKLLNDYGLNTAEILPLVKSEDIPSRIMISTMTITFKLGTKALINNFAKYAELSLDKIISVNYRNKPGYNRSLLKRKKRNKKKKTKRKSFSNQVTIEVKQSHLPIYHDPKEKRIC